MKKKIQIKLEFLPISFNHPKEYLWEQQRDLSFLIIKSKKAFQSLISSNLHPKKDKNY